LRDLALVRGASAGFLFGADFTGSGSEMPENLGVLKINRLDVFLTEIASHNIRFAIFNFQFSIFKR